MALPSSGPISMSQINTELAVPATTLISLNQSSARALAQVPAGMISLSNFYGKSTAVGEAAISRAGWNIPVPSQPVTSPKAWIWTTVYATETLTLTDTANNSAFWYASSASDTSTGFYFGGYTVPQNTPPFPVSNRIDKYVYSTKTNTYGIGTTVAPAVNSTSGFDGSGLIYTYNASPIAPNAEKFSIATSTSSPATAIPAPSVAPVGVVRDSTSLYYMQYNGPTIPTGQGQIRKFTYATQTFSGTFPMGQNRYTGQLSTANFAYICYGDGGSPAVLNLNYIKKYNKTTWANVANIPNGSPPAFGFSSVTTVNEGTNWGHIIAGFNGGPFPSNRRKIAYATDTFSYIPTTSPAVIITNQGPRIGQGIYSAQPSTFAF